MDKEVTGGMGMEADARIAVLEQNAATHRGQISELFQRMIKVEQEQSAQAATQRGMQETLGKIERNTGSTSDKLDRLIMWMMGGMLTILGTAIFLLIQWAAK
jgi:uncharacterized coiled-coil protein SlyX